jgi:hypothetical protein
MMTRQRRSACFAITMTHVLWDKKCFIDFLMADNLIDQGACGEESHVPPLDALSGQPILGPYSIHHHIFIRCVDKQLLVDVRDWIIQFMGLSTCFTIFLNTCGFFLGEEVYQFDIQSCKSPKSWLIYLSKGMIIHIW